MKLENYRLFAQLCEGLITEVSSSLSIVQQNPGGDAVIKQLHTKSGLGHDQTYSLVPKISWSDLKDSYKGAWVIIIGSTGTGAIKATGGNTGNYEAIASNGGEVASANDSRGGNILDFLKSNIGTLKQYYVGKNTSKVADVKRTRAGQQANVGGKSMTTDTLVKKFKPLWAKAINQAIPDIKGMAITMIKNDAFEKAEKKLALAKSLESAANSIEAGEEDIPSIIKSAVAMAVTMSASHYYPDKTGEITRAGRYGSSGSSPASYEGTTQLLADITAGDTQKLGTILAFFKRNLISG
jgi:hypothetical protein